MFDDYVEWLLTMGYIKSANIVTDGEFTISEDCIGWTGNECIQELHDLIIQEIEKTRNG